MRSSYHNHYRQVLPTLLNVLDFHSNNTAYQPVIKALAGVREYVESRIAWYPADVIPPLEGVIPSSWEDIVMEKDSAGEERVNRLTYEVCKVPFQYLLQKFVVLDLTSKSYL